MKPCKPKALPKLSVSLIVKDVVRYDTTSVDLVLSHSTIHSLKYNIIV